MKLGICVVKCPYGDSDYEATIASVKNLPVKYNIHRIDTFFALQQHFLTVKEDWTLVLYEREALDSRFNDAIITMLAEDTIAAYKFYCTVKTNKAPVVVESVRLFKKGVLLREDALLPLQADSEVIRILDGWVYEHGTDKDLHKICWNGKTLNHVGENEKQCEVL